jgi:uncharacterized protein YjbI with pentapeptide repeats
MITMSTITITITHRRTGEVLYSARNASLREAVCAAVTAGVSLRGADLRGADLRWADLTGAYLRGADLRGANLRRAYLRGANLTGAIGLPAAPVVPDIDARILSAIEAGGGLDMNTWHTCETTHCRAGWAVHLAGEAGYALEKATTPYLAGRLIYEASRPGVPAPVFLADNEAALADLRACAARQKGGAL